MENEQEIEENELVGEAMPGDDYDFDEEFDVLATDQPKTEEVVEPEVVEETVVEEVVTPEETTVEEPKTEEETDPVKIIAGLNASLAAEREKKRAWEELAKSNKQPEQEQAVVEEKKFDWENPDSTIEDIKTGFKSEIQKVKLDLSASNAKLRHEDYEEKQQVFYDMATKNKAYINEMLKQQDPAEWAYQQASQQMSLSEIGNDPVAYKAQLTAAIKAELLAELKADGLDKKIEKAATIQIPPSASKIKGKVAPSGEIVISDDPLGDIFGADR